MKISLWLESLKPYLGEISGDWTAVTEACRGESHQLCLSNHKVSRWEIQTKTEPVFQKTSWFVSVQSPQLTPNRRELEIFNTNNLGWHYSQVETENFKCVCNGRIFELALIFEPYEEAQTDDDISWFWLWAKCSQCHRLHKIVDWELD